MVTTVRRNRPRVRKNSKDKSGTPSRSFEPTITAHPTTLMIQPTQSRPNVIQKTRLCHFPVGIPVCRFHVLGLRPILAGQVVEEGCKGCRGLEEYVEERLRSVTMCKSHAISLSVKSPWTDHRVGTVRPAGRTVPLGGTDTATAATYSLHRNLP